MANRPVNTGSGGAAVPPDAAPTAAAAPPPVHHDASPSAPLSPSAPASHRAPRSRDRAPLSAWLPYLIVLAGVAAGMFVIWQGSKYAGRGAALIGASLLAGALARLILPERYAGLLSSRRKASDVLAFAAFGAAVLAVAIALP
jgi:hypothetical protein